MAEYWANAKEPEYDVRVDVQMPGRSRPEKYIVNRNNHYTTRTTKVKNIRPQTNAGPKFHLPIPSYLCAFLFFLFHQVNTINQNVTVVAKGFGEVTVKVRH